MGSLISECLSDRFAIIAETGAQIRSEAETRMTRETRSRSGSAKWKTAGYQPGDIARTRADLD